MIRGVMKVLTVNVDLMDFHLIDSSPYETYLILLKKKSIKILKIRYYCYVFIFQQNPRSTWTLRDFCLEKGQIIIMSYIIKENTRHSKRVYSYERQRTK